MTAHIDTHHFYVSQLLEKNQMFHRLYLIKILKVGHTANA